MTASPRRRQRAPLTKGSKLLLILAALGFFGTGIYLGIQVAKPDPKPDFSRYSDSPGSPSDSDAGSTVAEDQGLVDSPVDPSGAVDPDYQDDPNDAMPRGSSGDLEIQRQPPASQGSRPRIALVIDDLGRSVQDIDTLVALGVPVTYAVLPFESRTREVVDKLRRMGAEIICHLPMEATSGANPGPGALLLSMNQQELTAATRKALAAVPGAIGANNHMGSGISANQSAITSVISVLAEQKLFFLDSRTSVDTVGYSVARQYGVPAAERQVFLDTTIDEAAIREQFNRLLDIARKRGSAIAIGHPHKATLDVLAAEVRVALEQGFEFVTASALLEG